MRKILARSQLSRLVKTMSPFLPGKAASVGFVETNCSIAATHAATTSARITEAFRIRTVLLILIPPYISGAEEETCENTAPVAFYITLQRVAMILTHANHSFVNACRASPSKRFCVADCEAGQLHCKPL